MIRPDGTCGAGACAATTDGISTANAAMAARTLWFIESPCHREVQERGKRAQRQGKSRRPEWPPASGGLFVGRLRDLQDLTGLDLVRIRQLVAVGVEDVHVVV